MHISPDRADAGAHAAGTMPTMDGDFRHGGGDMVQVRVAGVALDATQQHVILLKPIDELPGSGQILPIWIGQQEATSILVAIEGAEVPRPLAHDLMRSMIETLGAEVTRVEVSRIDD